MSSLIVDIAEIKDIIEHPNADRLEVCRIKGWNVITQKGLYKVGQKVIYAPPDCVLPLELSDAMDVTKYLSKGRIKTVKLRGYYSQGLIIPLDFLPAEHKDLEIGSNVADILGITKYEPPIPIHMRGAIAPYNPFFYHYTDIEDIKNFPEVLREGEDVVITEKIHGSSCKIGIVPQNTKYKYLVGSHNANLKEDDKNLYWRASKLYNLEEILVPGMIIYGEVYGQGVQKMHYGQKGINIVFFDIIRNERYDDYDDFEEFCRKYNLPFAPVLYRGPWSMDLLKYGQGKTMLSGNHIKEGFVVRPVKERFHPAVNRIILKYRSEAYLAGKYNNE